MPESVFAVHSFLRTIFASWVIALVFLVVNPTFSRICSWNHGGGCLIIFEVRSFLFVASWLFLKFFVLFVATKEINLFHFLG